MCDLFTPSAGSLDPDFFFSGPGQSPPCHLPTKRNVTTPEKLSLMAAFCRSTLYLRFFTRIPQLICPEPWSFFCLKNNQKKIKRHGKNNIFWESKEMYIFPNMSIYLIKNQSKTHMYVYNIQPTFFRA